MQMLSALPKDHPLLRDRVALRVLQQLSDDHPELTGGPTSTLFVTVLGVAYRDLSERTDHERTNAVALVLKALQAIELLYAGRRREGLSTNGAPAVARRASTHQDDGDLVHISVPMRVVWDRLERREPAHEIDLDRLEAKALVERWTDEDDDTDRADEH